MQGFPSCAAAANPHAVMVGILVESERLAGCFTYRFHVILAHVWLLVRICLVRSVPRLLPACCMALLAAWCALEFWLCLCGQIFGCRIHCWFFF